MRRTVTKEGFIPLETGRTRQKSALRKSLTGFTPLENAVNFRMDDKSVVKGCNAKRSYSFIRKQGSLTGFTLVEVIMASALLTIAIIPILKGLTQTNLNSVIIERRTQSLCLAQAKLNRIKAQSIYNFDGVASISNEILDGSYLCNTTIGTVNSNLKSVSVAVGRDQNGDSALPAGEIEITLQTQLARRW